MTNFDVFNGDADGICSLVQLRLAEPKSSVLVTGVKRDIELLQRVEAQSGDQVVVLDISMDKNMTALMELLDKEVNVVYADHHQSGIIPNHKNLQAYIDTSANTCTALIVNQSLNNQYAEWAVTAAFGDNLFESAYQLATKIGLDEVDTDRLKTLGTYLNYNGYGASLDDLLIHPALLYQHLVKYASPLAFLEDTTALFSQLESGFLHDMNLAASLKPVHCDEHTAAYILPNQKWARRVSGVYSNNLANNFPDRAHAVLTEKFNNHYLVSVRAPLNNKQGADELVSKFATGGGRKAAAGINELPKTQLSEFLNQFKQQFC
ncbi:MAG: acetyltransferase [Gammaproteobacteria bacterium CG22_combo_CG10-13_8_21_14_all_40_8]|nr:MAG: acetyltransferase [Gammaproteobacteria bacterium CG22_combo_CG10-13_8_21_14_all_40_8]